jgi:outer membrane lipoprotein SlyB
MNLPSRLSVLLLALAAALPLTVATPAHAQTAATTTLSASSFGVEQVRALTPGTELAFKLSATPGAEVTLQIGGATTGVRLSEVRPGVYEGDYTVRTRDRLTATSLVTARILRDGREMNATLDQSLVRGAPSPVQVARIGAFAVNAPDRIRAGDELKFSLSGVPGGTARVAVEGITTRIPLTEVSRGLYEATYTVTRREPLRGNLVATGFLKVGQKETSQRFVREQVANTNTNTNTNANTNENANANAYGCDRRDGRDARRADMVGATCGAVTAVGKAEINEGDANNVLGTVAGGVLGAVIGNQVGEGKGKDIARILGAVGGAYAGNRVQSARNKTTVYRVTVQLDDGSTKDFDHAVDPLLQVGARVKIVDGVIVRRAAGG